MTGTIKTYFLDEASKIGGALVKIALAVGIGLGASRLVEKAHDSFNAQPNRPATESSFIPPELNHR